MRRNQFCSCDTAEETLKQVIHNWSQITIGPKEKALESLSVFRPQELLI
jgi:hypothetical protein